MKLDATLIRRYDSHGPRYTSYPTAVQFHTGFDEQSYRRVALMSNAGSARPLSMYVQVPFCARPCFYCGCNKIITRNPVHAEQYLQRLQREVELQGALFERRRMVRQLHFGGGTPTYLTMAQLGSLFEQLARHFSIDRSEQRKFSIEIDPRTLDTVVQMRPDRIAASGYAHMPRLFKAQRAIQSDQLPDVETRLQLLALTVERLTDASYVYIGMDHFGLPEDDLSRAMRDGSLHRNFQGYSTHGDCDLTGLGAIGAVGNSYSQNRKGLSGYFSAIDRGRLPVDRGITLSMDDVLRREVIQRLMCQGELCMSEIEDRYALDFSDYFANELASLNALTSDGLLTSEADTIYVTERGRSLLRTIAMVFDAYLPRATSAQFSKVI